LSLKQPGGGKIENKTGETDQNRGTTDSAQVFEQRGQEILPGTNLNKRGLLSGKKKNGGRGGKTTPPSLQAEKHRVSGTGG